MVDFDHRTVANYMSINSSVGQVKKTKCDKFVRIRTRTRAIWLLDRRKTFQK